MEESDDDDADDDDDRTKAVGDGDNKGKRSLDLESRSLDLESEDSARMKKLRRAEAQINTREKRKAKDADLDKEVIPSRFSSSSLNSGSTHFCPVESGRRIGAKNGKVVGGKVKRLKIRLKIFSLCSLEFCLNAFRKKRGCFKKDSFFMVKIGLKSQRTWGLEVRNK